MEFEFFVSEKNEFFVATLIGKMDFRASEQVEALHTQLSNSVDSRRFILNLRDLESISKDLIPAFAQIQKTARSKKDGGLRLCGLKPGVREQLEKAGILRAAEISDNLQTAISALLHR